LLGFLVVSFFLLHIDPIPHHDTLLRTIRSPLLQRRPARTGMTTARTPTARPLRDLENPLHKAELYTIAQLIGDV
jgi:hypothetical protein